MGSSGGTNLGFLKALFCVYGFFVGILAFPVAPDDDRFLGRGCANPAAHQLVTWLLSEIHKTYPNINHDLHFMAIPSEKRNSELTSSIMGIPRTMVDNGR